MRGSLLQISKCSQGVNPIRCSLSDQESPRSNRRAFDGLTDILRPARCYGADLRAVLETKAKFGADDHRDEELLVGEGTIALGRIEEVASDLDGAVKCRDRFLFIGRTIGLAHGHTPETDRGHLESLTAKFPFAQHHECCPPIKLYTAA